MAKRSTPVSFVQSHDYALCQQLTFSGLSLLPRDLLGSDVPHTHTAVGWKSLCGPRVLCSVSWGQLGDSGTTAVRRAQRLRPPGTEVSARIASVEDVFDGERRKAQCHD